ncbi:MAG: hypothetical protein Q9201_003140 [Fulgogasparrea decipioides]
MGCGGEREKLEDARAEQKWGYINLRDFTSTSCYSPLSYGILYIFLLVSIAVYAVDLFTAANLLFFDRWSGQVKPVISFKIARWIFAACILLSLVLLVYRWIRAIRVIKSDVVAASYLDPLAVRIQSIRPGARGQGWRRFLVFAALTEGRKGAEYVALFTYFSFEASMRIIFAEGPRQLLNAQTLYSVMQANLVPAGEHAAKDGHSPIAQFWVNLRILADHNREQAAVLFGMLFTLIIWAFSVLSLLLACIFYIFFLWRHIPKSDGTLKRFCRRKIDTRLSKIVGKKVEKALAREDRIRAREAANLLNGGRPGQVKRQPTIPVMGEDDQSFRPEDLSRQTTQTVFASRPSQHSTGTPVLSRQPTVPDVGTVNDGPEAPSRSTRQWSAQSYDSYASDAPLMSSDRQMGHATPSRSYSRPLPSRSTSEQKLPYDRPPISRKPTAGSQSTQQSYNTAYPSRPPLDRMISDGTPRNLVRQFTDSSNYASSMQSRATLSRHGTQTPGPHHPLTQEFELRPQPLRSFSTVPSNNQRFIAYNPNVHNPPRRPSITNPTRNFTSPTHPPLPPMGGHFNSQSPTQRPGTAPLSQPPRSGTAPLMPDKVHYGDGYGPQAGYGEPPRPIVPARAATAEPGGHELEPAWDRRPAQRFKS